MDAIEHCGANRLSLADAYASWHFTERAESGVRKSDIRQRSAVWIYAAKYGEKRKCSKECLITGSNKSRDLNDK